MTSLRKWDEGYAAVPLRLRWEAESEAASPFWMLELGPTVLHDHVHSQTGKDRPYCGVPVRWIVDPGDPDYSSVDGRFCVEEFYENVTPHDPSLMSIDLSAVPIADNPKFPERHPMFISRVHVLHIEQRLRALFGEAAA